MSLPVACPPASSAGSAASRFDEDPIKQVAAQRKEQDRRVHLLRPYRILHEEEIMANALVAGNYLGYEQESSLLSNDRQLSMSRTQRSNQCLLER
jgi:hypothetical protein